MKANTTRLSREQAKEVLAGLESTIASRTGREVRDVVVKELNSAVQTYSWVGIYLIEGQELRLDAWSGPIATEHVRIPIGKGVCGFAAKSGRTEIVSDVRRDSRYLECFPSTRSEIVVPILHEGKVVGEIDIDSEQMNAFSSVDSEFLEALARRISHACAATV
jgi:L-methionine (R)-S-oxide reductase